MDGVVDAQQFQRVLRGLGITASRSYARTLHERIFLPCASEEGKGQAFAFDRASQDRDTTRDVENESFSRSNIEHS